MWPTRQEQHHQQGLCGRIGGRRRGNKIKTVPDRNPLSGGGGPEYDQVHQRQEKKVRETQGPCKYGEENGHEKTPSLEKFVQERLEQEKLVQEKLVQERHVQERLVHEKSVQQRLVQERVVQERLVHERLVQERLVQEILVQERPVQEKFLQEKLVQNFR